MARMGGDAGQAPEKLRSEVEQARQKLGFEDFSELVKRGVVGGGRAGPFGCVRGEKCVCGPRPAGAGAARAISGVGVLSACVVGEE